VISTKPYIMTTGIVFGLLTAAHLWRMVAEGPHVAADPVFLVVTLAAAALCYWAWRLIRRLAPSR
jgi:hypothetical protein